MLIQKLRQQSKRNRAALHIRMARGNADVTAVAIRTGISAIVQKKQVHRRLHPCASVRSRFSPEPFENHTKCRAR